MKPKKIPMRMCIACRTMMEKNSLLRIVKNKEGEIKLDFTGKLAGRGAYICDSPECIKKCIKSRALNKAFGAEVDKSIYDYIGEEYARSREV